LDNSRLIHQLCALERRTSRAGKDTVDHGPHGSDDVSNAMAGAIWTAAGRRVADWEPGKAGVIGPPLAGSQAPWSDGPRRALDTYERI
jgi:hypothetical protein